jgi:maleylacetoacetate isomerase
MKLYTYYRSSAAYRVRIALALKGQTAEHAVVHLKRAEHHEPAYAQLNPQRLIPVLIDGSHVINQPLAIVEYLEERFPEPPLLPVQPADRARVRALAYAVCCDIHPLPNMRVQRYLEDVLGQGGEQIARWLRHFIDDGLRALEAKLSASAQRGAYCHGQAPSLADVCLVPQLYNAARYGCDLGAYPTLVAIADACNRLPAFERALPENQPEAERGA